MNDIPYLVHCYSIDVTSSPEKKEEKILYLSFPVVQEKTFKLHLIISQASRLLL